MMKLLLFGLLVAFGVFLFVFGGYDDSPGAQLLGALIAVAGIVGLVKNLKKKSF